MQPQPLHAAQATGQQAPSSWWKFGAPVAVTVLLALLPAPEGLPQHAWYYFAVFAGVIVGLMLEPLPGGAVGLIGIAVITALAPLTLFDAEQLAEPGFRPTEEALAWALSGFSNGTVWLIFAAFMFALGYDKAGLGKRIALNLVNRMGKSTLALGYAVVVAEIVLAPVTPSATARAGGTIYPIMRNVPGLYGSRPNDPSARRIGSYIMWVGVAAMSVTSSLFLTGLAPNLLALELVRQIANVEFSWMEWFIGFAPVGIPLLIAIPLLTYWLYPPEVKRSEEVSIWAAREISSLGPLNSREIIVAVLVTVALAFWIAGGAYANATTVALIVVVGMLVTGVFTWDDMLRYTAAWNTLIWFATLVTLADGLTEVGFVRWFAESVAGQLTGIPPTAAIVVLLTVYFFSHYMFASVTAHATAMLPVMLAVGATIPDMPVREYALLLCFALGLLGIISPYGSGAGAVYYGSGYLPARDFWWLGGIFGLIFLVVFLAVGVPWVLM